MAGGIRITNYFVSPSQLLLRAPSSTSVSLAVPQRRVRPDRLRGRKHVVDELADAVTRRGDGDETVHGVWLLSGMGGCGKTTVALEVAQRLTGGRTQVWWVSGADVEGLWWGLRAVAAAAGAAPSDFVGVHPADVLWRHLDALTDPWLLVLDNIDDPAVLSAGSARTADGVGWLRPPGHGRGTVLITSRESRAERWGYWVHMVGIEPLSREDGAQVLRDLAAQAGGESQAAELAEHLGGLPLALDLAGSYLARVLDNPWPDPAMPGNFTAYRRSLDAHLAVMASDPDGDLGAGERTRRAILSTWELSLDLLHQQGADLARPLMRLLCAFGPAPVAYRELLNLDVLAQSELFPGLTLAGLQMALSGLAGLKLITIEAPQDTVDEASGVSSRSITIHPMVRAASRARHDFTVQALPMLRLITALLQQVTGPLDAADHAHWPQWQKIAPHGTAARLLLPTGERAGGVGATSIVAATELAVTTAQYYMHVGMYEEAITELKAVGEARTRLLGEEDPASIACGLVLAWALRKGGDLTRSIDLYQHLAVVGGSSLPTGHPYLQSVRTGRARVLGQLGQYEAAEEELRVVLAQRQADPRADPRSVLRIQADLARLAHKQGRLEEAVVEAREVRLLTRDLARGGDLEALAVGLSLVQILRDAGQAEEAEAVAQEVVEEHRLVLPLGHPDLLAARHQRARLLRDHEWDYELLEQAKDEFTDIWRESERRLGPDHPGAVAARHELGTVWHLLGRPDRAAEHFRAALEAGRSRLGEHHPNVIICARNLARVLAELAETTSTAPSGETTAADPTTIHLKGMPQ